ncbi:MAG: phage/plasmid replication protein, partial [Oscillospiraceae bacterium]
MYDNIDFRLGVEVAGGVNLLRETPHYFNVTGEHYFDGGTVISGDLNGYKISVSERGVNIKDGSLCKYHLGDNFQTLGRGDTERAIERLSDTLHLPVSEAKVTRLDVAQNFIMNHPPMVYMNHLGELKYSKRAMCA